MNWATLGESRAGNPMNAFCQRIAMQPLPSIAHSAHRERSNNDRLLRWTLDFSRHGIGHIYVHSWRCPFYGGLVSAKNVVSILTQSMALVGVVTITLLVAGNAIMGNGFSISAVADGFMLMNASQEGLEATIFDSLSQLSPPF